MIGDAGLSLPPIPANEEFTHYELTCSSSCTARLPHPIYVFADGLHMHAVGSQIYMTQSRNGSLMRVINRIDFWDFESQQSTPHQTPLTILPGDQINLHCIYNTLGVSQPVPIGQASYQEMCLDFTYYYPVVKDFAACGYARRNGVIYNGCTLDPSYLSSGPNPIPDPNITSIVFGTEAESCQSGKMDQTTMDLTYKSSTVNNTNVVIMVVAIIVGSIILLAAGIYVILIVSGRGGYRLLIN